MARCTRTSAFARAIACLLALCAAELALAADGDPVAVPKLTTRVTDLTNTLSSGQKSSLESKLAAWESRTGGQFAVLLVPTTKPEDIDQYSQRVTDAWKLGRKGIDDGILLLIAKNDKKLRLQVGKGFEGTLTDVTSKRIIDEVIVPAFRKNDFAGGIDAGVDKAIGVVAGEKLPAPSRSTSYSSSSSSHDWIGDWLGFLIFAGLGLFWVVASTLNRLFGRVGGSIVGGAAAGLLGWFLTSLVIVGVGAGIIVFLFLLIALASRGIGGGGGWMPGGFGHYGGGFSGGGGGSSSWSGGGGDFGGGGASGSWGDSGGGGGDSGGGGGSDS